MQLRVCVRRGAGGCPRLSDLTADGAPAKTALHLACRETPQQRLRETACLCVSGGVGAVHEGTRYQPMRTQGTLSLPSCSLGPDRPVYFTLRGRTSQAFPSRMPAEITHHKMLPSRACPRYAMENYQCPLVIEQ